MSVDKIQQLIGSLAKSIDDNEKLAVPILAAKLAKYVAAYPQDQTLGTMSRVIEKMSSNNTLFIKRAEFKSLYNKLYSRGTKVAEIFQDELGTVVEPSGVSVYQRDNAENQLDLYHSSADPILANALNSVFDGSPVKMYSQELSKQAIKTVSSTLDAWSLRPSSLTVDDGNDKFLMIKANYETPKGVTGFYIPIEIHNNKISEASVFMGNGGPEDLNNTNIKSYLRTNAGSKLKANGSAILGLLTTAATEKREISGAELALTKLHATRQGKAEFFQNQIVGQKVAEAAVKDVALPKSDEFKSFEEKFASPQGIATFQFGEETVKLARECIARELVGFGHKNPQVVVSGAEQNTIYMGVALNHGRLGFTVPIRIANGKISPPSVILCNGTIGSFSQETISALTVDNKSDYKAASVASPLYGLKPSELITNIKHALGEGNHDKAMDALDVLRSEGDAKAYAFGLQAFMQGLSGKTATAESEHKCSMMIKSASSEQPVCGHTGLPVHKTYLDKEGNCRPLYRKGMDEGYEAVTFNNHKIFG
jgi:hypothetical protein